MTPVNLMKHNSLELQQLSGECVDDSLSMDTQDIVDQPAFSVTEICVGLLTTNQKGIELYSSIESKEPNDIK